MEIQIIQNVLADVCKTKEEGGIGIRKLEDVAKEINIKLVWKYLQQDGFWAKWVKNKYCKNKNFWTIQIDNKASYMENSLKKYRLLRRPHWQEN